MGYPIELREIEVLLIAEMTEVGEKVRQHRLKRGAWFP